MTLDQIERELKAIEQFDTQYLLEEEHTTMGMAEFRRRQERKRELLELAKDRKTSQPKPLA
ncbi:MAG: hypothetical protein WB566_17360 [Terriglobales bacterium]